MKVGEGPAGKSSDGALRLWSARWKPSAGAARMLQAADEAARTGDPSPIGDAVEAAPPDYKDAAIAGLRAEIRELKAALYDAASARYRTDDPLRLKGWDGR